MSNYKYSVSIVLFNNNEKEIQIIMDTFFRDSSNILFFLVDNSPTSNLSKMTKINKNIKYIHRPDNPGFGYAHNIALEQAELNNIPFHFIVNPDVVFNENIIKKMIAFMESHPKVGMIMPQILNEDGTIQNLPKLLPSPFSVLMRKIKKPHCIYQEFINRYELRFVNKNITYNAPVLSGCFTLLRISAVKEIGKYDDRFFMYFEDWDLSRRMNQKFKTVYYPEVSVIHGYESGANKDKRLFKIFVKSAIHYFNKWGWIFDRERNRINKKTLQQFK